MPRKPRELRPEAPRIRTALHLEWLRRKTQDEIIARLIREAHDAGYTWDAIGDDLGISGGKAWHIANTEREAEESA